MISGLLVPHGVYDVVANSGSMTLGTSHDTSAFPCDALCLAWTVLFCHRYPTATEILVRCDGGGSNAARSLRFKEDLIALAQRLGVCLRIGHYPPYTSKWNPIAHRLFSQVERTWSDVLRDSPEAARRTVERAPTDTGLCVTARILNKVYTLGRKCSDGFRDIKDQLIRHDPSLGQWKVARDNRPVPGAVRPGERPPRFSPEQS